MNLPETNDLTKRHREKKKFRKDFTPEQYAQYLENMAKTEKYEHDGLESYEVNWDEKSKTKNRVS